jgi:preprotein translocase subunit SecG
MQTFFMILMFITALFLILLVLVQRGRGGGLTGALGGMGGQSAFGSKAGDLFTRITIGAAAFWIILCVLAIKVLNKEDTVFGGGAPRAPAVGADSKDKEKVDEHAGHDHGEEGHDHATDKKETGSAAPSDGAAGLSTTPSTSKPAAGTPATTSPATNESAPSAAPSEPTNSSAPATPAQPATPEGAAPTTEKADNGKD